VIKNYSIYYYDAKLSFFSEPELNICLKVEDFYKIMLVKSALRCQIFRSHSLNIMIPAFRFSAPCGNILIDLRGYNFSKTFDLTFKLWQWSRNSLRFKNSIFLMQN